METYKTPNNLPKKLSQKICYAPKKPEAPKRIFFFFSEEEEDESSIGPKKINFSKEI